MPRGGGPVGLGEHGRLVGAGEGDPGRRVVPYGLPVGARYGVAGETLAIDNGRPVATRLEAGRTLRVDNRHIVPVVPRNALLIERVLTKRGIKNIVRTTSGEDAMRLLNLAASSQVPRPDMILLDLQLPGVSGEKVLEQIKTTPSLRAIPVVVLSCSDSETDVARCLAAGANAFISKADNYEDFRRSVIKITDFWTQAARLVG